MEKDENLKELHRELSEKTTQLSEAQKDAKDLPKLVRKDKVYNPHPRTQHTTVHPLPCERNCTRNSARRPRS